MKKYIKYVNNGSAIEYKRGEGPCALIATNPYLKTLGREQLKKKISRAVYESSKFEGSSITKKKA